MLFLEDLFKLTSIIVIVNNFQFYIFSVTCFQNGTKEPEFQTELT